MFFKKTQHRTFDYTPRFYDPEQDAELKELERRKRRLGFRVARTRHRVKTKSPIYYLVMFAIAVFVYLKIAGIV